MARLPLLTFALTCLVACDPATPSQHPASGPVSMPMAGSAAATLPTVPAPASSPPGMMGQEPDAPLSELCGGPKTEPCAPLTEHLAALRAKECGSQPTPPTQRACGRFTRVDVDYGVVGYTRFFDTTGKVVGAIAHLYEYGGSRRYGNVPTDCAGGPATSVCTATPSASSVK